MHLKAILMGEIKKWFILIGFGVFFLKKKRKEKKIERKTIFFFKKKEKYTFDSIILFILSLLQINYFILKII